MTPTAFAAVALLLPTFSHADPGVLVSPAEHVEVRAGTGFFLAREARSVSGVSGSGLVPQALLVPVAEASPPEARAEAPVVGLKAETLSVAKLVEDSQRQSAPVGAKSLGSHAPSQVAVRTVSAVPAAGPDIPSPIEDPGFVLKDIAGAAQGLSADEALEILSDGGGAETIEARAIRAVGVHAASAQ